MSTSSVSQLSSLTQWSQERIRDVFESPNDDDSMRAVDLTFSEDLKAILNGKQMGLTEVKQLVLAMRKESRRDGLKVEWKQVIGVPDDASNRDGCVGGVYIIHGIWRTLPGNEEPVKFRRHKAITVRIKSKPGDTLSDSRRIVDLVFVASDVRVNEKAQL